MKQQKQRATPEEERFNQICIMELHFIFNFVIIQWSFRIFGDVLGKFVRCAVNWIVVSWAVRDWELLYIWDFTLGSFQSFPCQTQEVLCLNKLNNNHSSPKLRTKKICEQSVKRRVKKGPKMFKTICYFFIVITCVENTIQIQYQGNTFSRCLKQDKPSLMSCVGRQALETLQNLNEKSNFSLTDGVVFVKDEGILGRSSPINFIEQDPTDFR